jgi:hypothetical protein
MDGLAPAKTPTVDVKAKACLIVEACSNAPESQTRWTMRSVADRLAE